MNKIVHPLKKGKKGPEVEFLQEVLLKVLGLNILGLKKSEKNKILIQLKQEKGKKEYGNTTFYLVKLLQMKLGFNATMATGQIDKNTADRFNKYLEELEEKPIPDKSKKITISGEIKGLQNGFADMLTVKIYDKQPGGKQELGSAPVNKEGHFEFKFENENNKSNIGVIVKVFSDKKPDRPLVVSQLYIVKNDTLKITDLAVPQDAYKLPKVKFDEVKKLLDTELKDVEYDTPIDKFNKAYLKKLSGLEHDKIERYIGAHKIYKETGADREIIYALQSSGKTLSVFDILSTPNTELEDSIKLAADKEEIDIKDVAKIKSQVNQLKDKLAVKAIKKTQDKNTPAFVKLLDLVIDEEQKSVKFLSKYTSRINSASFFSQLSEDSDFKKFAGDLENVFHLGKLAAYHKPLVELLLENENSNSGVKLAHINSDGWNKIIGDNENLIPVGIKGKNFSDKKESFINSLVANIEFEHPTQVLAYKLEQAEGKDYPFVKFMKKNPDFEFRNTRVRTYLAKKPDVLTGEVEEIINESLLLERLFDIIPSNSLECTDLLLKLRENNIKSAFDITKIGRDNFLKLANPENIIEQESLKHIFNKAERKHATTLMLLSKYNPALNGIDFKVLPSLNLSGNGDHPELKGTKKLIDASTNKNSKSGKSQPLTELADIQDLFGSLNYCKCQHCKSVLSPSAYFVDLLTYLSNIVVARNAESDFTAKDLFLERRPDLQFIDLTCKNSDTPMPYIDLVNEVLENIIDNGVQNKGNRLVESISTDRVCQTESSGAELKASPEYFNAKVYNALYKTEKTDITKSAVFPWIFPFNLWWEEAHIYLNHLGLPRHKLIKQLRNHVAESDKQLIAAEYLHINKKECEILLEKNENHLEYYYGILDEEGSNIEEPVVVPPGGRGPVSSQPTAGGRGPVSSPPIGDPNSRPPQNSTLGKLEKFKQIKFFLEKTQLDDDPQEAYEIFKELLQSYYLNPLEQKKRLIPYLSPEMSDLEAIEEKNSDHAKCNYERFILPLDYDELREFLTNFHKFKRLLNKLDWTPVLFDKFLNAFGWDENVIVNVSYIQQLHNKYKIPLLDLFAWWKTIDTSGKRNYMHSGTDVLSYSESYFYIERYNNTHIPSLYEELFLNQTVAISDLQEVFALNEKGNDLKETSKDLLDYSASYSPQINASIAAPLMAALRLNASDLLLLIQTAINNKEIKNTSKQDTQGEQNAKLNLANLSHLYRVSSFCRAFKLKMKEYVLFRKLYQHPILGTKITPLSTYNFIEEYLEKALNCGFTTEEIGYLLLHDNESQIGISPTEQTTAAFLEELRSEIKLALQTEISISEDKIDVVTAKYRTLTSLVETEKLLKIIRGDDALLNAFLEKHKKLFAEAPDAIIEKIFGMNSEQRLDFFLSAINMGEDSEFIRLSELLKNLFSGDSRLQRKLIKEVLDIIEGTSAKTYQEQLAFIKLNFPDLGLQVEKLDECHKKLSKSPSAGYRFLLERLGMENRLLDGIHDLRKALINRLHFILSDYDSWVHEIVDKLMNIITEVTSMTPEEQKKYLLAFLTNKVNDINNVVKFLVPGTSDSIEDDGDRLKLMIEQLNGKAILPEEDPDLAEEVKAQKLAFTIQKNKSLLKRLLLEDFRNENSWIENLQRKFLQLIVKKNSAGLSKLDQTVLVKDFIGLFADADDILEKLVTDEGILATVSERFSYVLSIIKVSNVITRKLAENLELETEQMSLILHKYVTSKANPAQKAIGVFNEVDTFLLPEEPLFFGAYKEQFQTYEHLFKIAFILKRLKTKTEDIPYLFKDDASARFGIINLNQLPVECKSDSPTDLTAFLNLVQTFEKQQAIVPSDFSIFDVLKLKNGDEKARLLNRMTTWEVQEINFILGENGFHFKDDDYANPIWLFKVIHAFDIRNRIGAPLKQIWEWTDKEITQTASQNIRKAVKAKYGLDRWFEIAPALRNTIRSKQRKALKTYIISRNQRFVNEFDLYAHYLIDAEMAPCMMTSRIKLAICSAQLFMQRMLMGLEAFHNGDKTNKVAVSLDKMEEWKWRRQYRVWEANRQVFLYPENWIEPELRLDKTPFFEELETELMQNEINDERVKAAFENYLYKLVEISFLSVVGYCKEETTKGTMHHVFARTNNTPATYYYRKRLENMNWTPWNKIDLDIEGDHIIPVIINSTLLLFWAIFKLEGKEDEDKGIYSKHYSVQLAFSTYAKERWAPKKVTEDKLFLSTTYNEQKIDKIPVEKLIQVQNLRLDKTLKYFSYAIRDSKVFVGVYGEDVYASDYPVVSGYSWNKEAVSEFFTNVEEGQCLNFASSYDYMINSVQSLFNHYLEQGDYKYALNYLEMSRGLFKLMEMFYTLFNILKASLHFETLYSDSVSLGEEGFFLYGKFRFSVIDQEIKAFQKLEVVKKMNITNESVLFNNQFKNLSDSLRIYNNTGIEIMSGVGNSYLLPSDTQLYYNILDKNNELFFKHQHKTYWLVPHVILSELSDLTNAKLVNSRTSPFTWGLSYSAGIIDSFRASLDRSDPLWRLYYSIESYKFETFYHSFNKDFLNDIKLKGIQQLFKLANQYKTLDVKEFDSYYPLHNVNYSNEGIDFGNPNQLSAPYSQYNWELFFHVPFYIACQLSKNQQFEKARNWFHYIFNPTSVSDESSVIDVKPNQQYWKFRPFYEFDEVTHIQQLISILQGKDREAKENLIRQIIAWQDNPFQPHIVAEFRTVAYMRSVVMKYIDNLVAWGDQLFRRYSIESVNEATQLYVLAAEILGKKPVMTSENQGEKKNAAEVSEELFALFGEIENEIEDIIDTFAADENKPKTSILDSIFSEYFCIPVNEKLMSYWDIVSDRLFKIRNCMDIEGRVRQLPLYEPPIDPAVLVRAVASGVDIGSVLNNLSAPLPYYRFTYMLQKALELCNDIKSLGGTLLASLEKKDAEDLALLRSSHEISLLKSIKTLKQKTIEESEETLESTKQAKEMALARKRYYDSREFMNSHEKGNLASQQLSIVFTLIQGMIDQIKGAVSHVPDTTVGFPCNSATYGGSNMSNALGAFSSYFSTISAINNISGSIMGMMGGNVRRQEEWDHQCELASIEIKQVDKQIAAAEIRKEIAENDQVNHEKQIAQAEKIELVMKDKFTNKQLYSWMSGQLSSLFFVSYQMAFDIAKQAEKAYQHELGVNESFIEFGYWDSLKKGLLSGERLFKDLRRMEVAYMNKNKRTYELSKQLPLSSLNPTALLELKKNGDCYFVIPEMAFDLDYTGHYFRRIKSISISIPCVTGPYTNVNATLTLMENRVRKNTDLSDGYSYLGMNDSRFEHYVLGGQSIATSSGQNDSGLFEFNFRDERFLPFEGAGAISSWRLQLPTEFKHFDYNTISDVILHINYTAKEGGEVFKKHASEHLSQNINYWLNEFAESEEGMIRVFSLKGDFPNELHQLKNAADGEKRCVHIEKKHFPSIFINNGKLINPAKLKINSVHRINDGIIQDENGVTLKLLDEHDCQGIVELVKAVEIVKPEGDFTDIIFTVKYYISC